MFQPKPGPKYVPVTISRVRTPSEPSLNSETIQMKQRPTEKSTLASSTMSSGPSRKESPMITSTWEIGWKTPAVMLTLFALSIGIAVTHLLLFQYLDGKNSDGPNRAAPQSYISTASNILANSFGFALRACLATAFAQYLWHLLRASAMKVSTIELLFSIRSNPLQIFRASTLHATPTLCILALIMWILQIATGFPPGAITVIAVQKTSYGNFTVPTFNASFMGNGSGLDANLNSLIPLSPSDDGEGFTSGTFNGEGESPNLINRLARQVLIAGEAAIMSSPCGVNCSYVIQFEGPYVNCTSSITDTTVSKTDAVIYSGEWDSPAQAAIVHSLYNGTFTLANFNSTTLTPIALVNSTNSTQSQMVEVQQENVICTPGRALYTVNNTYQNNVLSRNVTTEPIDPLINLELNTHESIVIVPGFTLNGTLAYGTAPANWSAAALAFYRDNNMMAIFDAMMSWLDGEFIASLADVVNPDKPSALPTYLLDWEEQVTTLTNGITVSKGAQNNTVIDSTRFNAAFGVYSASDPGYPSFQISADTLNDYLFNMTISIMAAYGRWDTSAIATMQTTTNIYSFSQPLNLIIPYFLSLFISVPFILLGGWALYKNGVSATDGGFMQIVTTTTGSATLDRAAAGGCLGGEESVPQELKDLKIRFGEFIGREGPDNIKRAGFGVEDEVITLKKGAQYGVAKWI